ncbi:membrane-associated protein, putative [Bodo saltans]|uniref:Membrane-associated protein, putative n=1 Tax=Bodo saltans TaxID=75058 RepID=A0A0S4IW43_BODSA|nr:membrane-associated protein, putative [Bodo saltans]|eukprot:CUG25000.1 membrane-associated protein, putative [Bodo saltans]
MKTRNEAQPLTQRKKKVRDTSADNPQSQDALIIYMRKRGHCVTLIFIFFPFFSLLIGEWRAWKLRKRLHDQFFFFSPSVLFRHLLFISVRGLIVTRPKKKVVIV